LPGRRYFGFRPPRDERPRRRGSSVLWALFWLILLIVLLGLIFGGYRKGTQVNNPGSWVRAGAGISSGQR
jgi:hypothetical protein